MLGHKTILEIFTWIGSRHFFSTASEKGWIHPLAKISSHLENKIYYEETSSCEKNMVLKIRGLFCWGKLQVGEKMGDDEVVSEQTVWRQAEGTWDVHSGGIKTWGTRGLTVHVPKWMSYGK